MIEPDTQLFYNIISEVLGINSSFATRATNGIEIVEGDHPVVTTLCMTAGGIIMINGDFWRKNVKNKTDAKILMCHELLHMCLGDLKTMSDKDDKDEHDLKNFSMDMRINAGIFHMWMDYNDWAYGENILTRLYKKKGPTALLRHSSDILYNNKFFKLYRKLYPVKQSSYKRRKKEDITFESEQAIRHALKMLLPKNFFKRKTKLVLLGTHAKPDDKNDKEKSPDGKSPEHKEVKPMSESDLEDLKSEVMQQLEAHGAGQGGSIIDNLYQIVKSNRQIDMGALEAFACGAKINTIKCFWEREKRVSSVIPIKPSNTDLMTLALGYVPTLWNNRVNTTGTCEKNVAIYLDVSGSVDTYLPKILGVISSLRKGIKTIFCFSTVVHEQQMSELRAGQVKTTGGTNFTCIVEHAVENKIDKTIIFTDGHANLSTRAQELATTHIKDAAVVFFGSNTNKDNWWSKKYGNNFLLEELLI
jgi:hypothetical protein